MADKSTIEWTDATTNCDRCGREQKRGEGYLRCLGCERRICVECFCSDAGCGSYNCREHSSNDEEESEMTNDSKPTPNTDVRLFELRRVEDESGISGTGRVAQGIIFENGWCALTWLTERTSVAFYTSIDEVVAIHGHAGKTRVVQVARYARAEVQGIAMNAAQDELENTDMYTHPTRSEEYLWNERAKLLALFHEARLDD